MNSSRALVGLAILAGIALIVVAGVYFADTARALPSFFPGHDPSSTTHHVKHGIAAIVVALGCFVFAWFRTGPKTAPA